MPARSVSTATIAFGLVSIPVKLYTTVGKSDEGVRFTQLHEKDAGRLQQRFICTTCGETVEQADAVRGYEHAKGCFTVLTADELKALDAVATQTIAVEECVPASAIDPVFVEKSFYVGPDRGAERSFRLLWAALVETGRVAIGAHSANRRQAIVCLRPLGDLLVLHQLRYGHEVIPWTDVALPKFAEPSAGELALAKQMVEQLEHETFSAAKYKDEVQQRVMDLVQRKVEGEPIEPPAKIAESKMIDLLAALRESLKPKR